MAIPDLLSLRADIDDIDEQLVALLGRRFHVTAQAGVLKAREQRQAVDPEREARQARRYEALANAHGLNPEFIQALFRGIIDEVVVNHRDAASKIAGG
jgi:chorismate mutase